MKTKKSDFTFSNLIWGGILGFVTATGAFFASYVIREDRSPLAFDSDTFTAFYHHISWPWFVGIVVFLAIWGYLFNNRLGEFLSDLFDWFRIFR